VPTELLLRNVKTIMLILLPFPPLMFTPPFLQVSSPLMVVLPRLRMSAAINPWSPSTRRTHKDHPTPTFEAMMAYTIWMGLPIRKCGRSPRNTAGTMPSLETSTAHTDYAAPLIPPQNFRFRGSKAIHPSLKLTANSQEPRLVR
jgi:hypothetical protein